MLIHSSFTKDGAGGANLRGHKVWVWFTYSGSPVNKDSPILHTFAKL